MSLIFGDRLWGLRLVELVWIVALGWITGWLATPRGQKPLPGVRGSAILMLSVLYFGYFNYWDTAQFEVWYSGLVLCALAILERIVPSVRSRLAGGALCGLAVLVKPVALLSLPIVVWCVVESRARAGGRHRSAIGDVVALLGGMAAVGAIALVYFAAVGALPAALEVGFGATLYHVQQARLDVASGLSTLFTTLRSPLMLAAATLLIVALRARRLPYRVLRRYVLAGLLLLASVAAVVVQRQFYSYHFAAVIPALALLGCYVADDLAEAARWQIFKPLGLARLPIAISAVVLLFFAISAQAIGYWADVRAAAERVTGRLTQRQFQAHFDLAGYYSWSDDAAVGAWLARDSRPGDLIAVRGFEPAIYILSGRAAPTRFFNTHWFTDPAYAFRPNDWIAEDLRDIEAHPPRYVVAAADAADGPDSIAYFLPLGYHERFQENRLVVLERAPD